MNKSPYYHDSRERREDDESHDLCHTKSVNTQVNSNDALELFHFDSLFFLSLMTSQSEQSIML